MSFATRVDTPISCSARDLREFERLVRLGFDGSDEGLPARVRAARLLALHCSSAGELVAIAGLKEPDQAYRIDVFERSQAGESPAAYELELGWVYVAPNHRGKRLGETLCRRLLEEAPEGGVFATTRPDNAPMIHILRTLGFVRTGTPYRHVRRDEELTLLLLGKPARESPDSLP